MITVWRAALAALVGASALVTGCGTTPDSVFYMLSGGGEAPAATSTLSVVVGPVTLPDAVDRQQLVISTTGNRVQIEEFHRWAEPLKSEIPRVIAAQLRRQLGTPSTASFSDVAIIDPDFRVLIDVQRFESRRGEAATVEALWTVRSRNGRARTGHTLAREPVADGSYDALVAAHGRALAAVSKEIGNAIQAFQH
jgi:uncharacterized protein